MSNAKHNAELGNKSADSGVSRCECGCKYWKNDRCIDCGTVHDPARHDVDTTPINMPLEEMIRSLAGAIALQAEAINDGGSINPLGAARLIRENADTLVTWIEQSMREEFDKRSAHRTRTTYGKAGANSVPKAQAHCSCGWTSRRVATVTDAELLADKHVAAQS